MIDYEFHADMDTLISSACFFLTLLYMVVNANL